MKNSYQKLTIIKETDTILVKYAPLPITSTCQEFLVQQIEPIELIPTIKAITMPMSFTSGKSSEELLKEKILKDFKEELEGVPEASFLHKLNNVKLIECNLLFPKREIITSDLKMDSNFKKFLEKEFRKYPLTMDVEYDIFDMEEAFEDGAETARAYYEPVIKEIVEFIENNPNLCMECDGNELDTILKKAKEMIK